jgi:hypothetical protein
LFSAILIAGTILTMIPAATVAQSYEDSYGKDQKSSNVNIQKVKCNNIIINGLDSAGQGTGGDMIDGAMTADEQDGTGQGLGKGDKKESNDINENIINLCKNKNTEVVLVEEPLPPSQITTLYVVNNGDNTVEIYDISDPTVPVRVDEFGAGDLIGPVDIAIQGTTLYVTNAGDDTVEIYDISDPESPVRVDEFNAGNLDGPVGITTQVTTL